jgi:hypothetical protein
MTSLNLHPTRLTETLRQFESASDKATRLTETLRQSCQMAELSGSGSEMIYSGSGSCKKFRIRIHNTASRHSQLQQASLPPPDQVLATLAILNKHFPARSIKNSLCNTYKPYKPSHTKLILLQYKWALSLRIYKYINLLQYICRTMLYIFHELCYC